MYFSNTNGYASGRDAGIYAVGSATYASGAAEPVSSYVSSKTVRMIGCTCGGHGPCRGTCRTPMPE